MMIIPEKIISKVEGRAIPKPANHQNTDDILPANYLNKITFKEMSKYVFFFERYRDGKPALDHPFNDQRYAGANILIAGVDFGAGSSREHAPQALKRYGISAIIAGSYAGIFETNCGKIGVPAITVPEEVINELADYVIKNPNTQFTIDLKKKQIEYDGKTLTFEMSEARRQSFLDGTWDEMSILQQSDISKIEQNLPYLFFK